MLGVPSGGAEAAAVRASQRAATAAAAALPRRSQRGCRHRRRHCPLANERGVHGRQRVRVCVSARVLTEQQEIVNLGDGRRELVSCAFACSRVRVCGGAEEGDEKGNACNPCATNVPLTLSASSLIRSSEHLVFIL